MEHIGKFYGNSQPLVSLIAAKMKKLETEQRTEVRVALMHEIEVMKQFYHTCESIVSDMEKEKTVLEAHYKVQLEARKLVEGMAYQMMGKIFQLDHQSALNMIKELGLTDTWAV
jgi:hypothetical protein